MECYAHSLSCSGSFTRYLIQIETLQIKEGISSEDIQFTENCRTHHDSGVVSPQNDVPSDIKIRSQREKDSIDGNSPSTIEIDLRANCNAIGTIASPSKSSHDEDKSELDGGLGSSVCGEDIGANTNLADEVSNQAETGKKIE